jgi:hypothetical protein
MRRVAPAAAAYAAADVKRPYEKWLLERADVLDQRADLIVGELLGVGGHRRFLPFLTTSTSTSSLTFTTSGA